jgi:hypothetical protein
LAAAGRIAGRVQAERLSAGLGVTASRRDALNASSHNKTVAQDVRPAIGSRAARWVRGMREPWRWLARGQGGVPLVWLNEWFAQAGDSHHRWSAATLEAKGRSMWPRLFDAADGGLGGAVDLGDADGITTRFDGHRR